MLEHTALVNRERESLERIGYEDYTKNQNLFRFRGATATGAGKPDLIGKKHHELLISDAKTGRPSPSHQAQVRIYQYAVPRHGPLWPSSRTPPSHRGTSAAALSAPADTPDDDTLISLLAATRILRNDPFIHLDLSQAMGAPAHRNQQIADWIERNDEWDN